MKDIKVRLVTDPQELEEVYRFRYKVLIDINRFPDSMNHETKQLEDSVDKKSYILAAFDNDKMVGTLRFLKFSDILPEENKFDCRHNIFRFENVSPKNSVEIGRYIVEKDYEKHGVGVQLMKETLILQSKYDPHVEYVFIEVYECLVPYYKFLNFKVFSDPVYVEAYNDSLVPMVLEVKDVAKQFALKKE
ncbi:MAG: GNAT family N-acetyltransferase [Gammaproteobacteria bacterium]|nr:GNAT family N-acetyltransferase [Gammaproteobacteria bacterium]